MKESCFVSPRAIVLLLNLFPVIGNASDLHRLVPYVQPPGTVMHVVSQSRSTNGTATITEGDTVKKGKVTYQRDRKVERRAGTSEGRPLLDYKVLSDVTKTTFELDGRTNPHTIASSITGQSVIGLRSSLGVWKFSLPDIQPTADQIEEVAQIEAYENNHLMPGKPVRLKESWPIEPAFIRHHTERGIGFASIEAIARLDEIQQMDGEPTAIITFTVETVATEGGADVGHGAGATIKAAGELHISLKTMLDKRLTLYGSRTTVTLESGVRTRTVLPLKLEVVKTLVGQ